MLRPSPDLLLGIQALKEADGVEFIDTLTHDDDASSSWVIHVRLTIVQPSEMVPATTDWYILVNQAYPLGLVEFHPAEEGGLHSTFRHMQRNDHVGGLWRTGVPCLDHPGRWLGSAELAGQPNSAVGKIRFYAEAALKWLAFAARDALTEVDESFELPCFTYGTDAVFGFDESPDHFSRWTTLFGRSGRCIARQIREDVFALDSFIIRSEPVVSSRWGSRISRIEDAPLAFWIALPEMPVIAPWDVPRTWGALRKSARGMGVDFDGHLKWVYYKVREAGIAGDQCLLIGFPIPSVYDGPQVQMHWQALVLPAPISGKVLNHVRANSEAVWTLQVARTLSDDASLNWVASENWSEERLRVRGALDERVRKAKVVLIGVGSLGSCLAEMLVREGVNDLLLLDSETLEVGNLRRHVLTLEEVGRLKSVGLADRLNSVSPFARVRCGPGISPSKKAVDVDFATADVIIDCTANEDVIGVLAHQLNDGKDRWFFSGSFGLDARRLFLYTEYGKGVNAARYASAMHIPISEERQLIAERGLADMHGAGCWNPVFPARWSHVQILAAEMLHGIERALKQGTAPANPLETIPLRAA